MSNQITATSVDLATRFMAMMFDERDHIGVSTGFQAFFGRPETGAQTVFNPDSKNVDIDIIRGNERIAALIHRGGNSRPLNSQQNENEQKFTSFSRQYPLMEEEGDIESDQLINRVAGENPYQLLQRLTRMRILGFNIHKESIRRIIRACELLASQSVLTGQHVAISGTTNTDYIYDFMRNADLTTTVGTAWNDTTPDIFGDIDGACTELRVLGHVTADMMVIGSTAMQAFLEDATVQTLADNRRIELIEVSMNNPVPPRFARFIEGGFIARGRLRTPGGYELWMFTYNDVYTNNAGTAVNYMPVDEALICFSGARCDRYFGPPEVLPTTSAKVAFYQEMFGFNPAAPPMPNNIKGAAHAVDFRMAYFDAYISTDWKKISIRSQAAPIFATTMTDAFALLDGLIT